MRRQAMWTYILSVALLGDEQGDVANLFYLWHPGSILLRGQPLSVRLQVVQAGSIPIAWLALPVSQSYGTGMFLRRFSPSN